MPLQNEDSELKYSFFHHLKVTTIPLLKFKWQPLTYVFAMSAMSLTAVIITTSSVISLTNAAPGTLTVSINQKSGTTDPNPSYTSVFEVVFSEAIDETTFTDADITLGGTAPGQTVQSITESGSFDNTTYDIRIEATSAGTIQPTIAQELVVAEADGANTNQTSSSTDNTVTYDETYAPDEFVTTWKTDNPGTSGSTSITIPTFTGETYSYDVDWDNDGVFEQTGITGNVTHDYGAAGTYIVRVKGTFPRIYFNHGGDKDKILTIEQWGTNAWASMEKSFSSVSNLSIPATDAPNMSNVTEMKSMFSSATNFNSDIGHWDVSNVANMQSLFFGATSFNQNIDSWDVGNVETMYFLFNGATTFNQPLNNWDVSSVLNMNAMFWTTTSFNQPLNNWDVSNVTDMGSMFVSATSFDQPLNSWDTSSVLTMGLMFSNASSFNQDISNWDVSNVGSMASMFNGASSFNQPLSNWDVSSVLNMYAMFGGVSSFNQSLANWDVSNVTNMQYMLSNTELSLYNYDSTLDAWSDLTLQSNVTFDAGTSSYCLAAAQRQSIITTYGWTINDSGEECLPSAVTTKDATEIAQDSAVLNGVVYPSDASERGFEYGADTNYGQTLEDSSDINYSSFTKWGSEGSGNSQFSAPSGITTDRYGNVYVVDRDLFTVKKFDADGNYITQWGSEGTADGQFTLPFSIATDSLNNVYISDISQKNIQKFDADGNFITKWAGPTYSPYGITIDENDNVYVTNYYSVIKYDSDGNQLLTWGTQGSGNGQFVVAYDIASDKNGNIFVSDVNNQRIQKFDTDGNYITKWSSSTYMLATNAYGQVYTYDVLPSGDGIKQYSGDGVLLGEWGSAGSGDGQMDGIGGMTVSDNDIFYATDTGNYRVNAFAGSISVDLSDLDCGTTYHYRAYAINNSVTSTGEDSSFTTLDCPDEDPDAFILQVKTDNPGDSNSTSIIIPTVSTGYDYDVDWDNDGIYDELGITSSAVHDYGVAGTYTLRIKGTFPQIYFNDSGDEEKVLDIIQWGTSQWRSMENAFFGATNLTISATDAPDLSLGLGIPMDHMFEDASSLNQPIGNWDVSNVTSMESMFRGATSFNQSLNNWDVSNVTTMRDMFRDTTYFNQPLNNWNVGNVIDLDNMFFAASSFNQPLNNWNVGNVTEMWGTFRDASSFNQSLNNWDVSNVTRMEYLFNGASVFNGDLNNWDVSNVVYMNSLFSEASSFDKPLDEWDTSSVINMERMFWGASSFDQPLNSWNVSAVTEMDGMFGGATSFNQSLSSWDVDSVEVMNFMFYGATSFNQSLNN
ncbi:BspA family leucine-rich repeat surface protein, partial [Candidatus Saccharibacteria bacterium]|nr:BspA family leucine-rich repeat surface protein [Candidatus Saccharibacteria bacterium]